MRKLLDGKRFVFPPITRLVYLLITAKVTDAVHANGSYIFLQLWALGRTADPNVLKREGLDFVAPSPIALGGSGPPASDTVTAPRELTVVEIKEYVQLYVKAASNAMKAGFDGVEVHGANGYLVDQFLQTVSNERTDEYGGSVENRIRFALEVIDAVVETVGAERTGFRCSPWSQFQGEVYPFGSPEILMMLYRHGHEGSAAYFHRPS